MWEWLILILVGMILYVKNRGWFWKDKKGKKLSLKQFLKRWKEGVTELTPLQQTRITLWSFSPIFAGLIWGIIVTFLVKTYWLSLILIGSLPITSIQFISNYQKLKAQKKAEELMQEAIKDARKRKRKQNR